MRAGKGARRTVLVLDGDPEAGAAAVRTRWFVLAGSASPEDVRGTLADPCPPGSLPVREPVAVVVCCAALDIERLASDGFTATPVGRWQRAWLMWQRRRDGTPGSLAWLGRHACSDARAAVQRDAVSPAWNDVLNRPIDTDPMIGTVSLPERLLAAGQSRRAMPRFSVLQEENWLRHVLVIDGVACFARRVPRHIDPHAGLRDIAESLAHALDRWSVQRIALDLGELPVELCDAVEPAIGTLGARVQIDRAPGTSEPGQTIARLAAGAAARYAGSDVLLPSNAVWRHRITLRRLQRWVAAGSLLALVAAVHAGTFGIDKARSARVLSFERESVLTTLRSTNERAQALHAEPARAVQYLEEYAGLGASEALSPVRLLTDIARTVTRHEAIVLDAVAWSHRPTGAPPVLEEAVYTEAANLPFAHRGDAWRLAVELVGQVVGSGSLRRAQDALAAFVADLDAQGPLQECRLLASPLSAAASGPGRRPAREAPPEWQLRCVITNPVPER